ncbi:MAG TPA: hypothetical protein VLZ81_15530 [Blastocatellia bacterium]|nr:hypothetical protein [Blastocatellia bacterium]
MVKSKTQLARETVAHGGSGVDAQPETRFVRVDKISSSTINLRLEHELEIAPGLGTSRKPQPGDVVVARTLTDNATYNVLELVSGRLAKLNPGDIIAGVLGYRRALKGFVGDVPNELAAGDRLNLLNMGGLIGKCLGRHHSLNNAIEVEVLGLPVRKGRTLNIKESAIEPEARVKVDLPLVLVAGTCMNSGKTYAATEIIKHLARAGMRVAAAKLAGVACLRDTLNMQDHGAVQTLSFLDCGLPSTVGVSDLAPFLKGIVGKLAESEPDCIVIELGDGIIGGYGVETVFADREVLDLTAALVFCANDFVGAWGGRELMAKMGVEIAVVSGPVTDSQMGADYVRTELGLPAANAVNAGEQLSAIVKQKVQAWSR